MLSRLSIALLALAAACGGTVPAATTDATVCQARASFGDVSPTNPTATGSGSGSAENIQYLAAIDGNAKPDVLDIELFAAQGDFTSTAGKAIVPGTYDLSMNGDGNYATCGVCVQLWAGYDTTITNGADPVTAYYVANGGSVTLTSVSPIAGTASGLRFRHVDFTFDNKGAVTSETDDADSCLSRIDSIDFNTPVTM